MAPCWLICCLLFHLQSPFSLHPVPWPYRALSSNYNLTPLPRPFPVYSRICFFFALYLANSCIAFILEFKYSLQFSGGGRASVPGTTLPLKTHKYQNLWVFQSLAQNSMVFAFNLQISCYIFKIISKWLMTPSIIQVLCKLLKLVLRCLGINTRKKSLYICHIYTHYIHHMYLFIV